MEDTDRDLIIKVIKSNSQLKRLYEEHESLEKKLAKLEKRKFLTSDEALQKTRLKRQKLFGVDRIMEILAEHRAI